MSRRTYSDRDRRPGRRTAFREPGMIIYIFCEGAVTERDYLNGCLGHFQNRLVKLIFKRTGAVPLTLVQAAKEARSAEGPDATGDEFWCVFDTDDHPRVEQAKLEARDSQILLAVSNPSFELWLLLHCERAPGMIHRDDVRARLKSHHPDYNKQLAFDVIKDGYRKAVLEAIRLRKQAHQTREDGRNPSTDVDRLTERIRGDKPYPETGQGKSSHRN